MATEGADDTYREFIENQINNLMATDHTLQLKIQKFINRVRLFFIVFIGLNIALNIIRFNVPDYTTETPKGAEELRTLTYYYIPL